MAVAANGRTWAGGERSKLDEDLFIFGYSCKLFRDDDKAMLIDRGKHLIPWMGDDSLMIDRYDARGYLHNVEAHEPKPGAVDYLSTLSEEERALEELCEEERYLALFRDLHEESVYQEEELKRLKIALNPDGTYKEMPFSYDAENSSHDSQDAQEDAEAPFKAPRGLCIPPAVPTPPTMKLHAIIEKTAMFVSQHGAQMEILVKTKQAANPQFAFLAFDHPLNVYYRFLAEQIKCGTYTPVQQSSGNEESDDDDDHYLHPSLFAASAPSVPPEVSKVFLRKEGEDNAYLQLVKNLKPHVDSPIGGNSPSQAAAVSANYGGDSGYEGYGTAEDYSQPPPPPGLEPILLPSKAPETGYAIPPPPDVQPIIDKMASYVAKNGDDFETIVKSKGDKRFEFLLPDHEYHLYYLHKKQTYLAEREHSAPFDGLIRAEPASKEEVTQSPAESTLDSVATQPPPVPTVEDKKKKKKKKKKSPNGLNLPEDVSRSSSPFPTLDSNDGVPSLGSTPTERSYAKGPVSFTLKLKDAEGKDKKRLALDADESDSEGRDDDSRSSPSVSVQEPISTVADRTDKDKHQSEAFVSKDRLSPGKQLQLERKKRLAKFLSMIKESPAPATSVSSSTAVPEAAKGSVASKESHFSSRVSDLQRSPTDSLPGSPVTTARRRRGDARDTEGGSSDGSPPPLSSRKSSSRMRHRSRSPGRHRRPHHRHHHHHTRTSSRSRSRERHRRKHRSPPQSISRRSGTNSPSPVRKSKLRKSRSRTPTKRK